MLPVAPAPTEAAPKLVTPAATHQANIQVALAETRLLAPQTDGPNPFSKGMAKALGDFKVGDSYTSRVVDLFTKVAGDPKTHTVTSVTDLEVIYNDGQVIRDLKIVNPFGQRVGKL